MQTPFSGHVRAFQTIVHPLRFRYKSVPFSYRVRRMIDLQWFTAACTMSEFLLATLEAAMWIVSLHQFLTTLHVRKFQMICTSPWNQARGHTFLLQISADKCCTCDAPQNCSKQRGKTRKLCLDVLMSCCLASNEVIEDMVEICWNSLRWPHLASVHLLHKRQSRRF